MNKVEKALMHGLFVHLHHNIDKAIDFGAFKKLNEKVDKTWPGALLVGPDANDDAAVVEIPGEGTLVVGKMESHNSPCVPRPYDAAATGAGGAMRDVVAMGGRPLFALDFIGTRPLEQEVLVGPCGFKGECTCGNCETMTSQDRLNIMLKGIRDMCNTMDVFVAGGGFSTSFSDIVPACVVAVVGKLVTDKPLTKPAKIAGNKIIVVGETGTDGNDTLYRAGLVSEMRPAIALFEEERVTMDASIAAFKTGKINACSDLGAAGIGAAVCESARYGGFGAKVDLTNVPVRDKDITPEEILICETQARMQFQVNPEDVDEVLEAIRSQNAKATVVGEITNDDKVVFEYQGKEIASIPNNPSEEILDELRKY
ncbi:AIR synthase-related protein [Dethiobacter alkaliphilus]|uniref:AIR synthase related protein domain protein n=1 Tax=Dethiobacter alkaliphilus AHT 1 TaxID=555088 RepID=C0GDB3_DETAL|nr:AIR synthase-related protein [Dethiobacter alkaliphilus]EEG78634.1 AIR synthase related protein domain protein [Dethiobacter alkaliphilus AHT 1]